MTSVLMMVSLQAVLGAFDNLWHHELQARLPQRTGARHELLLHALREAIYAVIFAGLAWWQWQWHFGYNSRMSKMLAAGSWPSFLLKLTILLLWLCCRA